MEARKINEKYPPLQKWMMKDQIYRESDNKDAKMSDERSNILRKWQ